MAKRTPAAAQLRDPWAIALIALACVALVSIFGAKVQASAVDEGGVTLGVTGLVAAASLLAMRTGLFPRTRLGWAWTALLAWLVVSTAVSGSVWRSLMGEVTGLLGWFALGALTLVIVAVSWRGEAVRRLLETVAPFVIAGEVIATAIQLTTSGQIGSFDAGAVARGSLPNSTYLGEAMLLLLPWALADNRGGIALSRTARTALVASTVIVLAASGSRVAAAVALVWALAVLVRRSALSRAMRIAVTVGLVVAVAGGAFVFARGEVLGSAGVTALGERPQMWHAAVLAVEKRPVTGWGPDGFVAGGGSVTTPALAKAGPVVVFRPGGTDPHDLPLWVAVSGGLVGFALFVWICAELVLAWRARARAGADVAPGVWAVVGVTAVLLTAPAAIEILPLFAVSLGLSLAPPPGASKRPFADLDVARKTAGWVALGLLCVTCALYAANALTRNAFEVANQQVSPARAASAQAASNLWAADPHLAYLASLHWGYAARADRSVAARQPDLAAIERAVALDAHDPFVALELARTLVFYGAEASRIDAAFAETFRRFPLYPAAHAEYAAYLAQSGRAEEAREQIAIAELAGADDPDRDAALTAARAALSAK